MDMQMAVSFYDEELLTTLVESVNEGLAMAGLTPQVIGVSTRNSAYREVTALIGCVGRSHGSILINTSEELACKLAGSLMGEDLEVLDENVLDGICELCNIVAGRCKTFLHKTDSHWAIEKISTPSVVVGSSYFVTHYQGATSLSVDFEFASLARNPKQDMTLTAGLFLVKM
jgi:chemotaxis protein CheX